MENPGANVLFADGERFDLLEDYEQLADELTDLDPHEMVELTTFDDQASGERLALRLLVPRGSIVRVQEVTSDLLSAKRAMVNGAGSG